MAEDLAEFETVDASPAVDFHLMICMVPNILADICQHLSNADILHLCCTSKGFYEEGGPFLEKRWTVHKMLHLYRSKLTQRRGPLTSLHVSADIVWYEPSYLEFLKKCRSATALGALTVFKGTGIRMDGLLLSGELVCFEDPEDKVCTIFHVNLTHTGDTILVSAGNVKH